MFGLPPNESFVFLVDRLLTQVAVGENELIFYFDSDISITVESEMSLELDGKPAASIGSMPEAGAQAVRLLGRRVRYVGREGEGTLVLGFENSGTLRIFDTSQRYESFQIRHGSELFVI